MKSRTAQLILALFLTSLLSGCGTESKSASTEQSFEWTESKLYDLKFSVEEVKNWGIANPSKDIVTIKTYTDPERSFIEDELLSVIPTYCESVAFILEDGIKSDADTEFFQSFNSSLNGQRIQIEVKGYSDSEKARLKFTEFINLRDKCGSYIPKYSDGEIYEEVTRWEDNFEFASDYFFFDSPNNYSEYIGLSGNAIYSIYLSGYDDEKSRKKILFEGAKQLLSKIRGV